MKFHICVRPYLQQEKGIPRSLENKSFGIYFSDNYLSVFKADSIIDQLASPKFIFDALVKDLIDDSILSDVFPVMLVNGPNGAGKTHLIEGVTGHPTQWGQLYQIFQYLQENQAESIRLAAFIGGYGAIYDLYNYSASQFVNYRVVKDYVPEIAIAPEVFVNLTRNDDITFFITRTRQNTKQYKREVRELLLAKAFLFYFTIDQKYGYFLVIDAPLYGSCDNKMRNLLARFVINDKSVKKGKENYECSTLRLRKSMKDSCDTQRRAMNASTAKQAPDSQYKAYVSLRESRFFSVFRDFFEDKGQQVFVTCMSPIQTYFDLKRDSEWFSNCHKPIDELEYDQSRRSASIRHQVQSNIEQSRNYQRESQDRLANFERINSSLGNQSLYEKQQLDVAEMTIPLALNDSQSPERNLQLAQLSSDCREQEHAATQHLSSTFGTSLAKDQQLAGIVTYIDKSLANLKTNGFEQKANEQMDELVNRYHPSSAMNSTAFRAASYYQEPYPAVGYYSGESQPWQPIPAQKEAFSGPLAGQFPQTRRQAENEEEQQLISYLSGNLAQAKLQSSYLEKEAAEYKNKLVELQNTVFALYGQNSQLSRYISQAFELQRYVSTNGLAQKPSKTSDYELVLQQQAAAKDVLIDELKADYKEMSLENANLKTEIARLGQVVAQCDALQENNARLQVQIAQMRDEGRIAAQNSQVQAEELIRLRTKQLTYSEQIEQLNAYLARCRGFEAESARFHEQTLIYQSALYEMEAEIQQLKRELNEKDTAVQRLYYYLERRQVVEAFKDYQKVEDESAA